MRNPCIVDQYVDFSRNSLNQFFQLGIVSNATFEKSYVKAFFMLFDLDFGAFGVIGVYEINLAPLSSKLFNHRKANSTGSPGDQYGFRIHYL